MNLQTIETITEDKPDIKILESELQQAKNDAAWWTEQAASNSDIADCHWAGQDESGRKKGAALGKTPFPWEDASDTRIRLADLIITENVKTMKSAFFRGRIQAVATESGDLARSATVTTLLKWMFYTHMADDLRREVELIANWRETYGFAVQGIFWKQETTLDKITLDLNQITAQITAQAQGDPGVLALLEQFLDPRFETNFIPFFQQMFPHLSVSEARSAIKSLRDNGTVELDSPSLLVSKPEWLALMPYHDIFFPVNTTNLKTSRWIAHRQWLSETELQDRAITQGWDKTFVQEALKHPGQGMDSSTYQLGLSQNRRGNFIEEWKNLFEIYHFYYKVPTRHATQLLCTTFSPFVKDHIAKHEAAPYEHAQYPYIEHVRERRSRCFLLSRGIPELVQTWQSEIKIQRDYRSDRSSIAILPPVRIPANRGKINLVFGPAVQVPERRPNEFGWMEPPPFDQGTIEIERATRADCDEYFGRTVPTVNPNRSVGYQQDLVDGWLADLKPASQQTFQLMQQYLSDIEVARVVGVPLKQPFKVTKEEIRGQYDISIQFDVRDLDSEYLSKKMGAIKEIIGLDTLGLIDRAKLISILMGGIDPYLAEELVRQSDVVTEAEIEDEQVQFSKMSSGVEPPMKQSGNYQLRLQTLQNIIMSNPQIQQRLQMDSVFAALVQNRQDFLQHQIQQQQNAVTGRTGVEPVLTPQPL